MEGENSEPRYVISVAANILGVHVQTLRYYERAGMMEKEILELEQRIQRLTEAGY
jgi:predicted ATP-grasp superfamily ATP-dependent carboligase